MKKLIFLILVIILTISISGCTNPCEEKVEGEGICEAIFAGHEYDASTGKCVTKQAYGCNLKSGFDDLEECQRVCENK